MKYCIACERTAGSMFGAAGPRPLKNAAGVPMIFSDRTAAADHARDLRASLGSSNVLYYVAPYTGPDEPNA